MTLLSEHAILQIVTDLSRRIAPASRFLERTFSQELKR